MQIIVNFHAKVGRSMANPFTGLAITLGSLIPILAQAGEPSSGAEEPMPMGLETCIQRVVNLNETIQVRTLEWLASQKRLKAAKGIFEPDWVASVERNENLQKNTAAQIISLGQLTYDQRNTLFNGALEFLTPTGAKVKLGYSLQDLRNNLQQRVSVTREFQSFAGITLTQPLMKNGGFDFTMANIRLAAGDSEVAYQEYRRQMCIMIARAEVAYWDLYFAQEQHQIRSDSVHMAETLLADNRLRLQAGKGSDLDVLQAEAGVALRQTRQKEALQKRIETMNRLNALISGADYFSHPPVRAIDQPAQRVTDLSYSDSMREAIAANPDYLSQMQQVAQEKIRVLYARNQLWPQLDLKGSYGLNGLGGTIGATSDDISKRGYESWSAGIELRIPLSGGIKGRNELKAAQLRQREALVTLKSVEVELATAMDTVIRRITNDRESIPNHHKIVDFSQQLLKTELSRLEAGKGDSHKVLDAEESLSETKTTALQNLIEYEKAMVEWELLRGAKLRLRNLEFTKSQLETKTYAILNNRQTAARPSESTNSPAHHQP